MLVLMADRLAMSVGVCSWAPLAAYSSALYIAFIVMNASLRPGVAPAASHAQPITLDLLGALAKVVLPPILLILRCSDPFSLASQRPLKPRALEHLARWC